MTAIKRALENAGADTDSMRFRALVIALRNDPSALWLALARDKILGLIAMRELIRLLAGVPPQEKTRQAAFTDFVTARAERERKQREAVAEARRIAEGIRALFTDRLKGGRLIHKMQLLEIDDYCADNDREAAFLRALKYRVRANDNSITIGETISPDRYDELRKEFYDS